MRKTDSFRVYYELNRLHLRSTNVGFKSHKFPKIIMGWNWNLVDVLNSCNMEEKMLERHDGHNMWKRGNWW